MSSSMDSRLQFNIFTDIDICDYPRIRWEIIGQGGFGRVEKA